MHFEGCDMGPQHQYLPSFPDHDIVVVTISDAQDVSSYTVAGAWQRELFYCLIEFVPGERLYEKTTRKWHMSGCVFMALINQTSWKPTNTPTQSQSWFPPRCHMKYSQEKEEYLWAMNDPPPSSPNRTRRFECAKTARLANLTYWGVSPSSSSLTRCSLRQTRTSHGVPPNRKLLSFYIPEAARPVQFTLLRCHKNTQQFDVERCWVEEVLSSVDVVLIFQTHALFLH